MHYISYPVYLKEHEKEFLHRLFYDSVIEIEEEQKKNGTNPFYVEALELKKSILIDLSSKFK